MKMSAFPLPMAGFPNLATTQLLMSAAGGLNLQAQPIASSPKELPNVSPSSVAALSGMARVPSMPNDLSMAGAHHLSGAYLPPHLAANMHPGMIDPRVLYSALNGGYDMKENADALLAWRQIAAQAQQAASAGALSYDAHAAAMAAASFSYPSYPAIDLNGARRKNATRETTSTLKAWLYEHRKNPYPTKGEKIMLAIITKMTLTQVSTWFANARRRLKKENKMTWSPRNRTDDGSSVDDEDKPDNEDGVVGDDDDVSIDLSDFETEASSPRKQSTSVPPSSMQPEAATPQSSASTPEADTKNDGSKPKIWSIADVAANKPSPPTTHAPMHHKSSSVRHRPYPAPNGTAFRPWFDNSYRHLAGHHAAAALNNSLIAASRPVTTNSLRVPYLSTAAHSVISPSSLLPPSDHIADRTIKSDIVPSPPRGRERPSPPHPNLSKQDEEH